ncbi:MAG: precorrin-8X methylmutase [Actinomycetota bacterium]
MTGRHTGAVHPIEVESYRILAERIDLSTIEPLARAMIERMIHATADLGFAETARIGERAGAALLAALESGAPVIVDAAMVAAGITRYPTECYLPRVPVAPDGSTRSAAAFRLAAEEHPTGAVFVCGNAPTALFELLDLHAAGLVDPAAVVGLPVGFVGATESKAALWASPLAPVSVTNVGERGGSPPAAGVVNAIVRLAADRRDDRGDGTT